MGRFPKPGRGELLPVSNKQEAKWGAAGALEAEIAEVIEKEKDRIVCEPI